MLFRSSFPNMMDRHPLPCHLSPSAYLLARHQKGATHMLSSQPTTQRTRWRRRPPHISAHLHPANDRERPQFHPFHEHLLSIRATPHDRSQVFASRTCRGKSRSISKSPLPLSLLLHQPRREDLPPRALTPSMDLFIYLPLSLCTRLMLFVSLIIQRIPSIRAAILHAGGPLVYAGPTQLCTIPRRRLQHARSQQRQLER